MLHACWVSFGFVACSLIFLFPFSILSITTATAVSLTLKTGKRELLRKETERSPVRILHYIVEISLAHVDEKQSVVIISYCKSSHLNMM